MAETVVMDALQARGFAVVRFNAKRIRMSAKAKGRLAKNDRADARVIAQATLVLDENTPSERRRDLGPLVEHLAYRRLLRDWLGDCANQLEHLRDASLRRQILVRQVGLNKALAASTRNSPSWSRRTRTGMPWSSNCARCPASGRCRRRH
jgi:transposase